MPIEIEQPLAVPDLSENGMAQLVEEIKKAISENRAEIALKLFYSIPLSARSDCFHDYHFMTMVMCAAHYNKLPMIEAILKDLKPLDQLWLLGQGHNQNPNTVFMIAEERGHPEIIDYLKTKIEFLLNEKKPILLTVLGEEPDAFTMIRYIFRALFSKHAPLDRFILDNRAELLLQCNENGKTALMQAIENGQTEIENFLIQTFKTTLLDIIRSPHLTVESGLPQNYKLIAVNKLLQSISLSNLPIDKRFELLNTAIRIAVEGKHLDILQSLLASCSDLTMEQRMQGFHNSKLRQELKLAARDGEAKMVQILLRASDLTPAHIADFLNKTDENLGPEDTALIEAARNGHVEVINVIFEALQQSKLEIEASLNCKNLGGETAVTEAVRNNQSAVIDLFFKLPEIYNKISLIVVQHINKAIAENYTDTAIKLFHSIPVNARFDCLQDFDQYFMTILMCAAYYNNLRMIEVILKDKGSLSQLWLLGQMHNQNPNAALMIAEKRGHTELINYLKIKARSLLNEKKPILLRVITDTPDDFDMVVHIFNAVASSDHRFVLENRAELLLQYNENGKTALMQALENGQTEIANFLIWRFKTTLFNMISSPQLTVEHGLPNAYKSIAVNNLLQSISLEIKLQVLTCQFEEWRGGTIPMMAVYFDFLTMVQEMFSGLSIEQQAIIFYAQNHDNKTILMIAQEKGFEAMVVLLQALGARLPAAPLKNDSQSTHNQMVHDSVARSAVNLMVHYLKLSQDDSLVLKAWAQGSLKDKQAMQLVVQKETTQQAFQELMQEQQLFMNAWIEHLSLDIHKQVAARRAIHLIRTHPEFISYLEGNTKIGVEQLLSLVWSGIHDEQDHRLTNARTSFETRCENGRESLGIQLFEAIRDKNLTNGQDLDPKAEDRRKCPDGFFNNLTGVLVSLKPEVAVLFVSKATVALKALFLISTLFDTAEYTKDEIIELDVALEETNLLSSAAKNKLAPKIMQALHVEFDEFINSGAISLRDLEQAVINALELRGEDCYKIVMNIKEKVKADPRMPKDATEEETEQEPESGTAGMKRKSSDQDQDQDRDSAILSSPSIKKLR